MDANGTRFHLLLGRQNWAQCLEDGTKLDDLWKTISPPGGTSALSWDADRQELTLAPKLFQYVAAPRDRRPSLDDRRGAAQDQFGNWYWIIDDRAEVLVNSSGTGQTTHFWSATDGVVCEPERSYGEFGPRQPSTPPKALALSGLTVTEDHYLVVGTTIPPGLLVFDLYSGGPPSQIEWPDPEKIPFAPWDMAPMSGGGVWILDRTNRRYWAVDRTFHIIPQEQLARTLTPAGETDFFPVGGSPIQTPARTFPQGITLESAFPLPLHDPIAIEALPDGSVLLLDRDDTSPCLPPNIVDNKCFSRIYCFRFATQQGNPLSTVVMRTKIQGEDADKFTLHGHDFAFVPAGQADAAKDILGTLYVAGADGNQSFAFHLLKSGGVMRLEPLAQFLPMRLFGGKAIVRAGDKVYYDFADRWIPLTEQHRPRFEEFGTLRTPIQPDGPVLDGHEPDCQWHRLFLDACIPPGTAVTIRSRAANTLGGLPSMSWEQEPGLYQRSNGSELPYVRDPQGYDTFELLLQNARGRYIQLEFNLEGNGQSGPRIKALRIYYPRFSYLAHYVPGVYREDQVSASFLDRFLANLEGIHTAIEDRIAAVQALFDVGSAPAEALDWLAGWFGVALDPAWDEARRRLFIRHAMVFFQWRGTIDGLRIALQLALNECPDDGIFNVPTSERLGAGGIRIIETYRLRRTPGLVLGDPSAGEGIQVTVQANASQQSRWTPEQGQAALQKLYSDFLEANKLTAMPGTFGFVPPKDHEIEWTAFVDGALGFTPSTSSEDSVLWRAFLARHYHFINALNDAWRLLGNARYTSFSEIALPTALPASSAWLKDWHQFHSIVLEIHRKAHHFTALLPLAPTDYGDSEQQQQRLALAKQVIELEKPAHTTFDVKFYWAAFLVGQARLGYDTLIDSSRSATHLLSAMILGQGKLVETHLASAMEVPSGRYYKSGDGTRQ